MDWQNWRYFGAAYHIEAWSLSLWSPFWSVSEGTVPFYLDTQDSPRRPGTSRRLTGTHSHGVGFQCFRSFPLVCSMPLGKG